MRRAAAPFDELRATLRRVEQSVSKALAWQRELMRKIREALDSCNQDSRLPYYRVRHP